MVELCYLCGRDATKPLILKESFTARSGARVPTSKLMCDRCDWCILLRCWYYNEGQKKWSKLFSRNWSWLFYGSRLIYPIIRGTRSEGKDTLPVVSRLPTRADIRHWLLHPPEPPFTLAIAVSGQKHILPWAREAHSKQNFPVQFELDTVYIDLNEFENLLKNYEALLKLEFNKAEIDSGEYKSDRLVKYFDSWSGLEELINSYRGSLLFRLVSFVAQKE